MTTKTKPELKFTDSFRSYACIGDTIETEHMGLRFVVKLEHDELQSPLWENSDGHGPVTDWVTREPNEGERILSRDRGLFRYYDFAQACKTALRDGWDCLPFKQGTPEERAPHAAQADFAALKAWCNDEWQYCAPTLSVWLGDDELDDCLGSLCGVEMNYPSEHDNPNEYLQTVANELLQEHARDGFGLLVTRIEGMKPDEALETASGVDGFNDFPSGYLSGMSFTGQRYATEDSEPVPIFSELGCSVVPAVDELSEVHERMNADEQIRSIVDCLSFMGEAWEIIDGEWDKAGSDFHLTRNGHGAGFWDGAWPEHSNELTKLAKAYGTREAVCWGYHIDDWDNDDWEGIDNCLETSFFEYGLVWKTEEDETKFRYASDFERTEEGPTRFHWAWFANDLDVVDEFDWVDWPQLMRSLSHDNLNDWLSLPLPLKIVDLVNHYGTENVFGIECTPGNLIHCDETRRLDVMN